MFVSCMSYKSYLFCLLESHLKIIEYRLIFKFSFHPQIRFRFEASSELEWIFKGACSFPTSILYGMCLFHFIKIKNGLIYEIKCYLKIK